MKKGFTLVELLVVIAIALVIGAGVYVAYVSLVREAVTKSLIAKNEQDITTLLYQLKKDLSSIGFGIDRSRLRISDTHGLNNDGVINCNSLSAFVSFNTVVARCGESDRQEELYFLSFASRQQKFSGCWWSTNTVGQFISRSIDYMLAECPQNLQGIGNCLALDLNKNCVESGCAVKTCETYTSQPNRLIFFTGNGAYPTDFAVRYYISNTNLPRDCAPQTFNLLKAVQGDAQAQPVASCVGAFRVRYLVVDTNNCDNDNNTNIAYCNTIPDGNIRNLLGVRLCLLVQVGSRTSTNMEVPQFSANCGGAINIPTQDWRWYRWRVVEEDIILENIR